MGFSTVLIISLAAGVILIVGGGVMMYMANLVKSAYEIKVQITAEVDDRLTKMAEDLDKKSRWIKRDLLEEIEKIKVAVQSDNARKLEDLLGPLQAKVERFETFLGNERAEWVKAVEADRAAIAALEARVKAAPARRKTEDKPALSLSAAPVAAGESAPTETAGADAIPSPAPAPQRPSGPTPVGAFLQELR